MKHNNIPFNCKIMLGYLLKMFVNHDFLYFKF
jgi:hypothetical protein